MATAIEDLEIAQAKEDIAPFIQDNARLDLWSRDFFHHVLTQVSYIPASK